MIDCRNNFGQVATGGSRGGGGRIISRGPILGTGAQSVATANSGHGGVSNANAQAINEATLNPGFGSVFNQGIFAKKGDARATSNANSGNFGVSNANSQVFGNAIIAK